jgi:hypothetical protein
MSCNEDLVIYTVLIILLEEWYHGLDGRKIHTEFCRGTPLRKVSFGKVRRR